MSTVSDTKNMAQGIEQIGAADIVVGLVPGSGDGRAIEAGIARIAQSTPPLRAVVVHPPYASSGAEPAYAGTQWHVLAEPQLAQDRSSLMQSMGDSFRTIFSIAQKLGARSCAVIASDPETIQADWAELLLQPSVDGQFDLIAPCYARNPFEGLINRSIVYPLHRSLYGKQIRNPLGPDFGLSSALIERIFLRPNAHPFASLATEAVTGGMRVCQTHLGPRKYAQPDWTNLSNLLAQVLGPIFLDVERQAAYWQRIRGSQAVPEIGQATYDAPSHAVDVSRLIESFQLGARNLPEVWGMILAPSTLMELRRLARQAPAAFRMPDETWARIVYDFALAYRLRTMNRDQMLRALTPIYLGWVASYSLEVEGAPPEIAEQTLERLCMAYENTKSHFVARWRWPDRFNP